MSFTYMQVSRNVEGKWYQMTEMEATVPVWRQVVVLSSWQPITVTNQTVLAACSRELCLIIAAAELHSLMAGRFMTIVCQRGAKGVGNGWLLLLREMIHLPTSPSGPHKVWSSKSHT